MNLRSLLFALLCFVSVLPQSFAAVADAAHRPFHAHVPNSNGNPDPRRQYREPYVEISNSTTVTVYQVTRKFQNGSQLLDQTGGALYVKGAGQQQWTAIFGSNYAFHANEGDFQYWKASFTPASIGIGPTEVIQYYFQLNFAFGAETTFIYAGQGLGDLESQVTNQESVAASNPFTIRNRPAWIFHGNNRVTNGNDVQFWAKVGYIGNPNDPNTRWATNGAVYYTTDGSDPAGVRGVGSGTSQVIPFAYSHPESNNQGTQSIAGTPMWWVASASNLLGSVPFGNAIRYKIGFWNPQNNEEKFAEHNAGANNTTFSFTNGIVGDPVLTVNGVNANYTTTHVYVNEAAGTDAPFNIFFAPGQGNLTDVEVFTNLNRRDRADDDADGDGFEDGIHPPSGNLIASTGPNSDLHYFKAYQMTNTGPGTYSLAINANKTGAYRLTARWKVSGDPNWRWYTNFGANRRDHAIVVTPVDALNINLYEMNVFNVEANGDGFPQRGTLEDLYDAPNAPHGNSGTGSRWNLTYLKNLGCNWLWFQPIHAITLEAQQGFDPGSPYSVRNFFEINSVMSVGYNPNANSWSGLPINPILHPDNRTTARLAFKGFVAAADQEGVGVMLDAPFNHTAPDCELTIYGVNYIAPGNGTAALFRDAEARFYSHKDNYGQRASGAATIAIAPDRGDFGKWGDVRDVFFGNYSALVSVNPNDNGNYNNEADVFDYTSPNWANDDRADLAGFQNVTRGVWKYFAEYTLHWLNETGVPPGSDLATQTMKGIDGLRADFGQGMPPQFWEYCINKTRSRKWNFVFMSESLDGGAVTYRSNRHFDVQNENIVFPLKSAGNASDYRNIFESRRNAYGQALVLMNTMSHDEEAYEDPWQAVVRYAVSGSVDGIPLIFPGQELGISRTFGYQQYETNFGKQIAHFKRYNSMMPAWNDTNYGNDQLYPVFAGINQARLSSPALRSLNRYFLNEDGGNQTIYGVAKYEVKNGSPAQTDVVLAFANTNRDVSPQGNFHINQDTDSNGVNDYGIKHGRTYDVKNIAAYEGVFTNRREAFVNRKTGTQLLNDGIFVAMNRVPTDNAVWATHPYEAQYLKVFDVTPPSTPPGAPTIQRPNAYGYAIENGGVFYFWAPVGPDSEGIQPRYKVNYQLNNMQPGYFFTSNTFNNFQINAGNTLTVWVQATNPNDVENQSTPGASSPVVTLQVIGANDDLDGDGRTNAEEDIAGTNPFSATSSFTLVGGSGTGGPSGGVGGFTITWSSVPGRNYQVQRSTHPTTGYMNISGVIVGSNNGTNSFTDTTAIEESFFYRVVALP